MTAPVGQYYAQPQQPQQYQPPRPRLQGLSWFIHGHAKAGKSSLGDSGPRPRLIVDVEGTSVWTPSRKTYWNPLRETPPQLDQRMTAGYGQVSYTPSWESCIVIAQEADTVFSTYQTLVSGRHPFNSLSMDSVTEVQQRVMDSLSKGFGQIPREAWNGLLRRVMKMARDYRDLINNPVKPLWSVTFIAGTHWNINTTRWEPLMQGQIQDYFPYYVDVLGYLGAMPNGERQLLIGPHPQYATGERVGGRLPYSVQIGYPGRPGHSIETMVQQVLQGVAQ